MMDDERKMKQLKLVICVILVFIVGLLAGIVAAKVYYKERVKDFAAGGPPESARIRMLIDRFSHDLELTKTQKSEIEAILSNIQDEIFQLNRKTFPQIEEINEKGLIQIKAKLNSEQKKKFNTFQNKIQVFHDRFAVRLDFPGRPPAPDIDALKDRLDLTTEQLAEIQSIMDEGLRVREEIMERSRKEKTPDFSKIRREMMDSENTQRKNIEKMLAPHQVEAYNKYMEERRPPGPPGPGHTPGPGAARPEGPPPPSGW